ncbi:hypothetical protein BGZ57DRAFT_956266, partial [Hyaloscypha finlandica]
MLLLSHTVIAVYLFQAYCMAQTSISPDICIVAVSLSNCDKSYSKFAECSTITDQNELVACVCTQELFSAYVSCEGEVRQCTLSNTYDSGFDQVIAAWHEKCDTHMSTPVTTPVIATPSMTLGQEVCPSIIESCNSWIQETSACKSSFTREIDLTSCECRPPMISLASVCEFDGNVSCIGTTAELSNLWEFQNCPRATGLTTTSNAATITGAESGDSTTSSGSSHGNTSPGTPISITPTFGLPTSISTSATTTSGSGSVLSPSLGLAFFSAVT